LRTVEVGRTNGNRYSIESELVRSRTRILDDNNLTEKLLPEHDDTTSPCLRYVDHDGDTVFNQLAASGLVARAGDAAARGPQAGPQEFTAPRC